MKTDKEIVGTLLGFDDFVSILCKEQRSSFVFATVAVTTLLFCLLKVCQWSENLLFQFPESFSSDFDLSTNYWNIYAPPSVSIDVFWFYFASLLNCPDLCPLTQFLRHGAGGCYGVVCTFLFSCICFTSVMSFTITNVMFIPLIFSLCFSEITPEGRRITKLDQILLNGNNITMVCEESAVLT